MSQRGKSLGIVLVLAVVVSALVWVILRNKASVPYEAAGGALSGWTIVVGAAGDPWVVALEPPRPLTMSLFEQLSRKVDVALVAPERPALPLVLQSEYNDALQGVYGIDSIVRIARDAGIESAQFEPVCVAHRLDRRGSPARELFFVLFDSPAFRQLRQDLAPNHPEHAGIGVYDPSTLTPVLAIAGTDLDFASWWPLIPDPPTDCQAPLFVK